MSKLNILFLVLFSLLFIGCTSAKLKTSLNNKDVGSFSFPMEEYTMSDKKVNGLGTLEFPSTSMNKYPLVVLVHGTKGVGYRENSWASFLRSQGFATFVIDYYIPRSLNSNSRNIPREGTDVWGALNILATHPKIDIKNSAVMGFSNGGSITRHAAGLDPSYETNGILPKAYIMVYGGCHTPIFPYDRTYKPSLLYIIGTADDLVRVDTCKDRLRDNNKSELFIIEGATHMFDGNQTNTVNHRKYGTVYIEANSNATHKAREKVVDFLNKNIK